MPSMSEQDSEHCGWHAPHEPHDHGFAWVRFRCPGIPAGTEYRLYLAGIKAWSQVRDEIIPAIRRDFPGVLVRGDERVVTMTIPVYDAWRGAELELLGLSYSLASAYSRALTHNLARFNYDEVPEIRALTEEEIERVREHRAQA
ncbi:hypothetical protein SEA_MAGRITTE_139 [Microbacterium phage Magritte]|nr:hypothetical protein SEA_MAGRITTE_139 [Microbacterium phage Magritte]